tara:strand:- start:1848 stop:2144 length:297 start_codon:yes stop_codon:yes gene_type:complete
MKNDFDEIIVPVELPMKEVPLESQLETEKQVIVIKECQDINQVKKLCIDLLRENIQQDQFITGCFHKIHVLTAKLACQEHRVVQPKETWWDSLFRQKP